MSLPVPSDCQVSSMTTWPPAVMSWTNTIKMASQPDSSVIHSLDLTARTGANVSWISGIRYRKRSRKRLEMTHITFLGGATGLYYGYLDFIAWDLPAVLDAANSIFCWYRSHLGQFSCIPPGYESSMPVETERAKDRPGDRFSAFRKRHRNAGIFR